MARADRILFVVDAACDPEAASFLAERDRLPAAIPVTLVFNKSDLVDHDALLEECEDPPRLWLSARTGSGLTLLRGHLKARIGFSIADAGNVSARQRHLDALTRARRHIEAAQEHLRTHRAGELMAQEFKEAQAALAEITGEFTSEDLLARIFASFCIGK
jgi:tRNA modification GTPase